MTLRVFVHSNPSLTQGEHYAMYGTTDTLGASIFVMESRKIQPGHPLESQSNSWRPLADELRRYIKARIGRKDHFIVVEHGLNDTCSELDKAAIYAFQDMAEYVTSATMLYHHPDDREASMMGYYFS